MWVKYNAFLFLIALVLVFLQTGCKGIKCFQCNSRKDEDCTVSKADSKYLKSCPDSHSYCRKLVYQYYFTGVREYSVIRECAKWRNKDDDCYKNRYASDSYQLTCECENSGCNGATKFHVDINFYVLCCLILLLVT